MRLSRSNAGAARLLCWLLLVGISLACIALLLGAPGLRHCASSTATPGTWEGSPQANSLARDHQDRRQATAGESDPSSGNAASQNSGVGLNGGFLKRLLSWISFERLLLLAVVLNYLALSGVGLWYWRVGRRHNLSNMLAPRFEGIEAKLAAIEQAIRALAVNAVSPPAPEKPALNLGSTRLEAPKERPVTSPGSVFTREPERSATPAAREPLVQAKRAPLLGESDRVRFGNVSSLVDQYCQAQGVSVLVLRQEAQGLGLRIGSPSATSGQRHVLNGPDHDSRLLAIKDDREERLFVVVGDNASVTEAEWLDLFQMRSFPGLSLVRSTRPAIVDATSGNVEQKGELEVLSST